jgi:hypothetical protein
MKSGNLNFLEPSGPLQACNETALQNMKAYEGRKPLISKHDIGKCRASVSHTGRFTPGVKTGQYPLNRRLGGRQNQSESCGEEKNLLLLPSIKPQFLGRPVRRVVIIPTYLLWLVFYLMNGSPISCKGKAFMRTFIRVFMIRLRRFV